MKVYVIMRNGDPDAVFGNQKSAEAYVENKNKHKRENLTLYESQMLAHIFWQSCEFELQP